MNLYEQLQNRIYPEVQHLDQWSISRFYNNWYYEVSNYSWDPLEFSTIKNYLPEEDMFLRYNLCDSIHGIRHMFRVLINIGFLVRRLEIPYKESIFWAAWLHDIHRINDNADIDHSTRAANWFIKNNFQFWLSPKEEQITYHMIKFHNIQVPDKIDGYYLRYIDILKKADALDRFRFPKKKRRPYDTFISDFTEDYIKPYKKMVYLSECFYLCGMGSKNAVLNAAIETWFIKL